MPTIILSYRREDTAWIAGRVHDRLKSHFGEDNVFMDIDSIPFGLDFREHIHESLDKCDILLAIVGPRWATADDGGKTRLSDETDWVRIEIEAALAKKIPVIPVLIDGVSLPPPAELPEGLRNLAFRQAAPVDSGRDFHPHMDRLIKAMDKLLGLPPKPKIEEEQKAEPDKKPEPDKVKLQSASSAKDGAAAPPAKEEIRRAEQAARTRLWHALTSLHGRMARGPFWVLMIASFLVLYVAAVGIFILWRGILGQIDANPAILLAATWLWVPFATGGKRLQDMGWSRWWVLIPMAIGAALTSIFYPVAGVMWMFVGGAGIIGLCALATLGFVPGSKGPNAYGPEP